MYKLALFALLAVGCGGSEPAPVEEPAAEAPAPEAPAEAPAEAPTDAGTDAGAADVDGGAIYKQYCVTCHGEDGSGVVNGVALGGSYTERLTKSDDELMGSIKNGKTGDVGTMPPWGGTLDDNQIKAVLAYVRTTYGGGAAPAAE